MKRARARARTEPYRDKQNDFSNKIFNGWINTFKGTENVVGFAIQITGGSYDAVFMSCKY